MVQVRIDYEQAFWEINVPPQTVVTTVLREFKNLHGNNWKFYSSKWVLNERLRIEDDLELQAKLITNPIIVSVCSSNFQSKEINNVEVTLSKDEEICDALESFLHANSSGQFSFIINNKIVESCDECSTYCKDNFIIIHATVATIMVPGLDYIVHKKEQLMFFDKTLFIKRALERAGFPLVILRPRRFGKSFNLGMLRAFVDIKQTEDLFSNTKIEKHTTIWENHYHKHPVISLSFGMKTFQTFERFCSNIWMHISNAANRYPDLETSTSLNETEKSQFKEIALGKCNEDSLSLLINLLFKHYNSKVVLLIDEYETPILTHVDSPFSKEVIDLFFGMFLFLKNDEHISQKIETAIFSGVILLKDKGYLSGMNNLVDYSLYNDNYFTKDFGVTEKELFCFLTDLRNGEDVSFELRELKSWYNGYDVNHFPKLLFNVWSLSCYFSFGRTDNYWTKTRSTDKLALLINSSYVDVIGDLEFLINGNEIRKKLSSGIDITALSSECSRNNSSLFWQIMYFSGYLTGSSENTMQSNMILLRIPNLEVQFVVCELMKGLQLRLNLKEEKVFIILKFKKETVASYQTLDITNYYKWISYFEEELECKRVEEKYSIKYYLPKVGMFCSFKKSSCETVFPSFTTKEFNFLFEEKSETDK